MLKRLEGLAIGCVLAYHAGMKFADLYYRHIYSRSLDA